ncbi:adenylosuccinate lyase [Streptomyces bacillaris]|uniref:adenylosuccinate lyase n=1 Tax=Streptomyces bacillaris TaxID=68179 RepID=UPI00381645E9
MCMDTLSVMDEELRSLMDRLRDEAAAGPPDPVADHPTAPDPAAYGPAAYDLLVATDDHEALARVLVEPGRPLWAREIAAFRLGCAGDRRAFEALVLLLNHRDPERCVSAAHALARLNDPRTPRAAAALATNTLRTAYAVHPVRLLTTLRAPEAVPALVATLQRLLAPGDPHWHVALACVEGLGHLGDPRARPVLTAALPHPRLGRAAEEALGRLPGE